MGLLFGIKVIELEHPGRGPKICLARNPHLVFGRVISRGQQEPLVQPATTA